MISFVSDAAVCRRMFHQLLNINLSIYYYLIVFFVPCVRGKKENVKPLHFMFHASANQIKSRCSSSSNFNLLLACIWLTCVADVSVACSITTYTIYTIIILYSFASKISDPTEMVHFQLCLISDSVYFIFMECILIFHLARNAFFFFSALLFVALLMFRFLILSLFVCAAAEMPIV